MERRPFDIHMAMRLVRTAVAPFPKAAMFELADGGFDTAFHQLVACIISIRTLDEVMLPLATELFARAPTPADVVELGPEKIDALIAKCTFHERKASQIYEIARRAVEEHEGIVPCDEATLLSFGGVGPKCTNLVLGIACGAKKIGVDIHVHRVTNRWGYVAEATPEATMAALERELPKKYWVEINRLLVPFGKHVCKGNRPKCETCPLRDMCPKVGVEPRTER